MFLTAILANFFSVLWWTNFTSTNSFVFRCWAASFLLPNSRRILMSQWMTTINWLWKPPLIQPISPTSIVAQKVLNMLQGIWPMLSELSTQHLDVKHLFSVKVFLQKLLPPGSFLHQEAVWQCHPKHFLKIFVSSKMSFVTSMEKLFPGRNKLLKLWLLKLCHCIN